MLNIRIIGSRIAASTSLTFEGVILYLLMKEHEILAWLAICLALTSMKQRGSRTLQEKHASIGHTFAMLAYEI